MAVERADLSVSLRIERPAPEPAVKEQFAPPEGSGRNNRKEKPRRGLPPPEEPKVSHPPEEDNEPPEHRIDDLA
jgi:hypothetical protein